THVVTFIGSTGLSTLGAIAFDASGVLYAVDGGSAGFPDPEIGQYAALYSLDPTTAAATFIGTTVGVGGVDALRFNAAGTLYGGAHRAAPDDTSRLVTINPATGTILTAVLLSGTGNGSTTGLAFAADGTLYASRGNAASRGEDLVVIDVSTGVETALGSATNVISDVWFNS